MRPWAVVMQHVQRSRHGRAATPISVYSSPHRHIHSYGCSPQHQFHLCLSPLQVEDTFLGQPFDVQAATELDNLDGCYYPARVLAPAGSGTEPFALNEDFDGTALRPAMATGASFDLMGEPPGTQPVPHTDGSQSMTGTAAVAGGTLFNRVSRMTADSQLSVTATAASRHSPMQTPAGVSGGTKRTRHPPPPHGRTFLRRPDPVVADPSQRETAKLAREYAAWLRWWKSTLTTEDYLEFVAEQETDFVGSLFSVSDLLTADTEPEAAVSGTGGAHRMTKNAHLHTFAHSPVHQAHVNPCQTSDTSSPFLPPTPLVGESRTAQPFPTHYAASPSLRVSGQRSGRAAGTRAVDATLGNI